MPKNYRTILFIAYAFTGLLTESFIFYLFPYTGLGGLICYPTTIILSLLLGWTLYKITKRFSKPLLVGLMFLIFVFVQFVIELYIHPQDFGGSPFQQIAACNRAYDFYDKISFDSFTKVGGAKRVAYIYKFKNKLPLSISILSIDSLTDDFDSKFDRRYMLSNFAHDTLYNTTILKLIRTDTSLVIIENPKDRMKMNVHITDKSLLNNSDGGVYGKNKLIMYNVWSDSLDLNTGIEKLFYKYLSWTKKASR